MISWLIGPVMVALAGAFVVVRIYEFISDFLIHETPEAARGIVFTGTWAAIQTKLGMNGVGKSVDGLRIKGNLVRNNKIANALIKWSDKGT